VGGHPNAAQGLKFNSYSSAQMAVLLRHAAPREAGADNERGPDEISVDRLPAPAGLDLHEHTQFVVDGVYPVGQPAP
jgi:hypothetical protein